LIPDGKRSKKVSARSYLDDPEVEESLLVAFLPPQYKHHYDFMFRRKFFACLITVGYKLAANRDIGNVPSSTAEELALDTIIEVAKARLELKEAESDFGAFYDLAFADLDYDLLYGGKEDGIEDALVGALMGIGNLHFDEWFEPFGDVAVHPYLTD
jgi:hypothetical protein